MKDHRTLARLLAPLTVGGVAVLTLASPTALAASNAANVDTSNWVCEYCPFEEGAQAGLTTGVTSVTDDSAYLGNGTGFSGELKYETRLQKNGSLRFGLQFRTWEFGKSNNLVVSNGTALCGQPLCTIYEPDSKTMQTVLSASYIHHF